MDSDITIRNGTIVRSENSIHSDIIIRDGKIIDIPDSSEKKKSF
jgi:formylmethanofuran dehydrogenase subunit A